MNTFPVRELSGVESMIPALEALAGRTEPWAVLAHQAGEALKELQHGLLGDLDERTRPPRLVRRRGRGYEYQGEVHRFLHWNLIDVHVSLLRRLWLDHPSERQAMARAMGCLGTVRAYVAQSRVELFPDRTETWRQKYSRELIDGWFVDTNLNEERMRRLGRAAVRAAGLKPDIDVKFFWRGD